GRAGRLHLRELSLAGELVLTLGDHEAAVVVRPVAARAVRIAIQRQRPLALVGDRLECAAVPELRPHADVLRLPFGGESGRVRRRVRVARMDAIVEDPDRLREEHVLDEVLVDEHARETLSGHTREVPGTERARAAPVWHARAAAVVARALPD